MRDALYLFCALSFAATAIYFNTLWTYTPIPEVIGSYMH